MDSIAARFPERGQPFKFLGRPHLESSYSREGKRNDILTRVKVQRDAVLLAVSVSGFIVDVSE